jgi:hypothetical protein
MTYNDDRDRAKSHIDRIRRGGGDAPPPEEPESPIAPLDDYEAGPDDSDSDALERVLERSERMRRSLGVEPLAPEEPSVPQRRKQKPQRSPMQAVLMVGGLIVVGVVAIIVVALGARFVSEGGTLPFGPTATPTETPPPTETPSPTETPTPTLSPTPAVPDLDLPVLTCIFQTTPSCANYCADPSHTAECDTARGLVEQQGADADVWLNCISPPGSERNVGDPQQCLNEAWLAANPTNP